MESQFAMYIYIYKSMIEEERERETECRQVTVMYVGELTRREYTRGETILLLSTVITTLVHLYLLSTLID